MEQQKFQLFVLDLIFQMEFWTIIYFKDLKTQISEQLLLTKFTTTIINSDF